jgi:hypothetical protein
MAITLEKTADSGVVAVIERLELGAPEKIDPAALPMPPHPYPSRTAEQSRALPVAAAKVRAWRRHPGFRGAVLLASRDHNRISVYSRFTVGAEVPPPVLDTTTALGVKARVLDRRTYDLAWRDGNETPTIVSLTHTPVVHFGLFAVLGRQTAALLARVATGAPASLVTPGLRTINFHRSHDGRRLVNVGTWSSFDDFHVLLGQPGFEAGKKYHEGLATFQNDYFDVIDVVE